MSSSDEKQVRLTGGFSFGFETVVGVVFGIFFLFVILPAFIRWLDEQPSLSISYRPAGYYAPTYYSDPTNPNADNVPAGFRVIKQ